VGYAAGMQYTYDAEGVVIKTTDGGDTWTTVLSGVNQDGIEAICFTSPDTGFIAGWNNYFAKTTDGGATWIGMNVGSDIWFFQDMEFWDARHGAVVSNLNSENSAVYITSNGGQSWTSSLGINQNIQDLAYADATTLYIVGANEKVSKSTNGGSFWTEIYSGSPGKFLIGVDFNKDFGVAGGEDGEILFTTDGGETWDDFATGYHNFQGVHVFDADSAYIGGTDEDVYKTTNWGNSWVVEDNGSGDSHIYKIKFTENNTGFLCGSQGMIKRKIAPPIVLQADFTADKTQICNWEQVHFSDLSTGEIDSWQWYFEGGSPETSSEQNPSVFFTQPGLYDVSLTINTGTMQSTVVKENYIQSEICPATNHLNPQTFSVMPNPAQDMLNITLKESQKAIIQIFEISGKLV
jgi:photosystem II stability/assembly factor-like uncharacterized protein